MFQFDVSKVYAQCACGYVKNSITDIYGLLQVELMQDGIQGTSQKLIDLISNFLSDETIDVRCGSCKGQKSKVSTRLDSLPNVLIVQVKRHTHTQSGSGQTANLQTASHNANKNAAPKFSSAKNQNNIEICFFHISERKHSTSPL